MTSTRAIAMSLAVLVATPALAEPSVETKGRPLRVSGTVVLAVGGSGLLVSALMYLFENMLASSLPVFPPATPSHTASLTTLAGSGVFVLTGAALLIAGALQAEPEQPVAVWFSPTLAPGGAGVALGARF